MRLPPAENKDTSYQKAVGRVIKELREREGMSRNDFAELMEVNYSTIQRVESGTWLSFSFLERIIVALGYDHKIFTLRIHERL